MNQASEALDFERAARLRDRLKAISHIQSHQGINPTTFVGGRHVRRVQSGRRDLHAGVLLPRRAELGQPSVLPAPSARNCSTGEVLEAFIGQFYDERTAPALVLLSETIPECELLAEALSLRAERKVEIAVPQRGEKREIVEMALQNAREQLGRRQAENSAQRELLEGVAELFGLEAPPKRIEVYDNSHIQGTNALGGMIVAGPEGFEKGEYRKFNIKSTELTPGDDYGMMREVLTRRFARLVKESESRRSQSQMARHRADRRRSGPAQCRRKRCWTIWASRTCRWWASPKARTAMRAASIST